MRPSATTEVESGSNPNLLLRSFFLVRISNEFNGEHGSLGGHKPRLNWWWVNPIATRPSIVEITCRIEVS
jgi:hypothetical protein